MLNEKALFVTVVRVDESAVRELVVVNCLRRVCKFQMRNRLNT